MTMFNIQARLLVKLIVKSSLNASEMQYNNIYSCLKAFAAAWIKKYMID